jgi:hypothetical protein
VASAVVCAKADDELRIAAATNVVDTRIIRRMWTPP